MPELDKLAAFAFVSFALALTPGPNMIYLVSRTLSQGRAAAYFSLIGTAVGFLVFMTLTALGITAVLMAVPYAYDALRYAGAAYLVYLAWKIATSDGPGFATRTLAPDSKPRLFLLGLLTNLLNPKAAMLYLSLLPQFIVPARGDVLAQGVVLGSVQIAISVLVNGTIIAMAGAFFEALKRRPAAARAQRYVTGTVLGALAAQMALESRKTA